MTANNRAVTWVLGLLAALVCCQQGGADTCTNECRMRQNFVACYTGYCMYMDRADCGKCTAGAGSACSTASPVLPGTCIVEGTNQVRFYDGCLLNCNCVDNGLQRSEVETQPVIVLTGVWYGRDWKQCKP